jgi:uncharacterized protein (UPF0333 family)
MKKIRQSGFTPVAVLLVLILVTLVGATGYYVYNTQQNNKDDTKLTAANPAATPAPPSTTNAQKYLVIKEWGVKVPLTNEIEDATYYYKSGDGGSAVYVSTKSITAKYPNCAADKTTIYAYGRYDNPKEMNELAGQTMEQVNPGAPKVGNYYYYAMHPQAYCFDATDEKQISTIQKTDIQPLMDAFVAALKKIQAE